jgi:ABC-type Na+ efflux pump permease subunit
MTSPLWLIAEREFRTYVATLSFWAALAIGPLAAGGGLLLAQTAHHSDPSIAIVAANHDANLVHATQAALREAAALEGRRFTFSGAGARLTVAAPTDNRVDLTFAPGFPLSATGRALVARTLERDAARQGSDARALTVRPLSPPAASSGPRSFKTPSRLTLMLTLWLTLTGSLGMLLQAVVRERATRSLESLLAAAAPWQIMVGKLAGVGGVSLLIMAAWIGSTAALGLFLPHVGVASTVIAELARPALLLRAVAIHFLAYAFYGSITVALGAMARDSASAQNLSRPMFVLLLLALFAPLVLPMGGTTSWLLYIPAFTPFLLLLYPAGALSWSLQLGLFALMIAATSVAAHFAIGRFGLRESRASLLRGIPELS